jgi:hypothetical protein
MPVQSASRDVSGRTFEVPPQQICRAIREQLCGVLVALVLD